MTLVPRVVEGLREADLDQVQVFVGGIVPDEDVAALKELGVRAVFGPGTSTQVITDNILRCLSEG
jgi:methylmalonyl-CoA mutase C-terminal domain/subunit